jgi:hypothetical protein
MLFMIVEATPFHCVKLCPQIRVHSNLFVLIGADSPFNKPVSNRMFGKSAARIWTLALGCEYLARLFKSKLFCTFTNQLWPTNRIITSLTPM